MNELALFAGAGGGILGGKLLGWRTVCAVELAPYARRVLLARQRDGILPRFPIWDDIRTFDGKPWRGHIDVISAGFPCTPFSVAGKREAGDSDKNMWPDTLRVIREVRPKHLLLENVPNLLAQSHGYMHTILGGLAESGYDCRWDCVPASALGANHQRDRLWIVAHHHSAILRNESGRGSGQGRQGQDVVAVNGSHEQVADADRSRCEQQRGAFSIPPQLSAAERPGWWEVEPAVGRVADGLAHRVDRLRALGNGQVPAVVHFAWRNLS